MWKKLTLIAALLGLAMLLVLPLAGTLAKGPSTPPRGVGRIAVNENGLIVMLNPDGSGRTVVAATASAGSKFYIHSEAPGWSPMFSDGTVKLAYDDRVAGSADDCLMVVDVYPTVGTPFPIAGLNRPGDNYRMDWSPVERVTAYRADGVAITVDKVRVAFKGCYVVDLYYHFDDSDPGHSKGTFEVAPSMYDSNGQFSPLVLNPGGWMLRFSPDGQWLALARNSTLPDGTGYKSVGVASSTDPTKQWALIDRPGGYDWYPAWSPTLSADGRYQLAFISTRDNRNEIYAAYFYMNSESGPQNLSVQRVTNSTSAAEVYPTWSPGGSEIAYHDLGGNPYPGPLGVVTVATGQQYTVGKGDWPDWSPMELPPLP